MNTASSVSLLKHLESLPDPRSERNRKHLLVDVVAIAVCGVLVGCDGPTAIRLWAEQREDWLREFLALPARLPSKDCLRRVLSRLKPEAFARCFAAWVAQSLAADGRSTARRCVAATTRRTPSGRCTWSVPGRAKPGFLLGQHATEEKSNEITAIPELLEAVQ